MNAEFGFGSDQKLFLIYASLMIDKLFIFIGKIVILNNNVLMNNLFLLFLSQIGAY